MEPVDCDYHPYEGATAWTQLLGVKQGKGEATDEDLERVVNVLRSIFLAISLEKVKPVIASELEGDFPIATINWFAVYIRNCSFGLVGLWWLRVAAAETCSFSNKVVPLTITKTALLLTFEHGTY